MIKVDFFLEGDSFIRAFRFAGHAETAPHGEDIVCAAISILSQTTVVGLEYFLSEAPVIKLGAGYLSCVLPEKLNSKEKEQSQIILKTMELGLKALEPNYGKYFELHRRRWTKC